MACVATLMILLRIGTIINTATTPKLTRLPQQINDRFDMKDKA